MNKENIERDFIERLESTCQDEAEVEFYLYAYRNPGQGCMNHVECCEHFRAGYNLAKEKYDVEK